MAVIMVPKTKVYLKIICCSVGISSPTVDCRFFSVGSKRPETVDSPKISPAMVPEVELEGRLMELILMVGEVFGVGVLATVGAKVLTGVGVGVLVGLRVIVGSAVGVGVEDGVSVSIGVGASK